MTTCKIPTKTGRSLMSIDMISPPAPPKHFPDMVETQYYVMHLRVRFSGGQGRRPGTSLSAQTDSVFCRSTDQGILGGISLWSELSEVSRPDRVAISSALTVCSCSKSKINLQLNAPTTIDTSWKSGDHTDLARRQQQPSLSHQDY